MDFDRTLTEADLEALKDGRITAMQLSTQIYEKSFGPNLGDIIYTPAECDMRSLIYLSENSLSSAFLSFSENNGITIDNDKHTIQITDEIREKLLELNQFHVGWQFSCSSDDNDFYAMLSDGLAFVDNKAPTLQSVSVPEGTYYIGQVVPITVTFSEPVRSADARITVNGMELTPESSSDGSDRLVFPYTVTTENATDFAGIKVTGVSGITDFGNNNMIDDTQTRSFEQAKISVLREKAFTSLSIDKESYSADGENALVEIGLNKDLSKWVEQDGGLDQIRISADGGATMIPVDWKRIEGVASDDTLVAEVKLPGNSSSSSNSVRIEIYLRDEENQEKYAIVLGKYCDAVIRPTVYPESIMIDESTYPDENIIYFVSPPTFTFTTDPAFSALEPEPQVTWTSSNPEVAAIDDTGKVTPLTEGSVFFTVILQGKEGPVSASTPEFQIRAGDLPFISMSGDITASIGTDTTVSWNTNVTYKNQQHGVETTTYTVRLYEGDLTAEQAAAAEPLMTWTVNNDNGFDIPAEYLQRISAGTAPAYTVTVSCGHPDYEDQTLTARAGIVTRALPVVVRFDTLENYFITDKTTKQDIHVTFRNADAVNGVNYSYTVKKNGEVIDSGNAEDYMKDSLDFRIDIDNVPESSLRDIYIVSIEAYNDSDKDSPSADSFILYVYRSGMMDIIVDGEKTDSLVLDNNDNPDIAKTTGEDATSEEIEQLREDANLSAMIGVDKGDYEWSNVDDQIAWSSSDNDVANLNYQQGGIYSDITQYDYSTFRPGSEFMIVGQSDGTTTITATHAKTGEQTKLDVSVTTLQDKLYVFNFYPRQTTTMTYTNGDGREVTLITNDHGEIAVYEESGIASDITLRSGSEDNLYLGTLYRTNLLSSENDPSKLELYPVNSFKLRPVAQLDLYLVKEDGTPYSGTLTVSGGVYKNGQYCAETGIKDQEFTIGEDGHFHLTMATEFWTESNTEALNAGDQLDYVFIARTQGDEYYPLFINVDGSVGTEEAATFTANALVVAKVPEGRKNQPFIAAQTARTAETSRIWSPVLYYSDIIGISEYAGEMEIKTTVLWWGDDSTGSSYDVYMTDESNARLSDQETSALTRYPFSDILVSENIVTINEENCSIQSDESMRPRINIVDGDGTLVLSQDTSFTFMNGVGIPLPNTSEDVMSGLTQIQPAGYETDTSDPKYQQGGDMVAPGTMDLLSNLNIESEYLTMTLYPTSNPGEWQFLVEAGIDKMKDDGGNSVMLDPSREKQSFLPGPMDAYKMLKGTYMEGVNKDFNKAIKNGTGKDTSYGGKIGGFYEGIVSWNAEKGKWEMKTRSGGFTYGLAAGYTWSVNTWVGPIPITASVSIGGGLEMDHKILMTSYGEGLNEEEFQNLLVTMRINAYVRAFVGLGFDFSVLALKFGVFGQVDLQNYNAFLDYQDQTNGDIKSIAGQYTTLGGSTGIEFYLKILFIQYRTILDSVDFTIGEWETGKWNEIEEWRKNANFPSDFGGYNRDTLATLMALSALPEFETVKQGMFVEDRNYLELADRIWGEPNFGIMPMSVDDEEVWQNLQSNSYPYANPMVTEDGKLLVFLSDGGESDLNRTRVEYSLYDDAAGTYGAPQALDPDAAELADSSLQLAGDSGFAVAVWQRQNQKMDLDPGQEATNDDLNAMMSATEIVASIYNGSTWTTTQLTDNQLPDMAPVAATNGEKAIVVWRKVSSTTAENVSAMNFDAQDSLVYKMYDGAEWGEEKVIYNGTMGAVKGLNVAMDSAGNAVVTYTVDSSSYIGQTVSAGTAARTESGAQSSGNENYEIAYSLISADGTVQSPVRFTTDSNSDENPQVAAVKMDGEERFLVAWYSQRPLDESGDGTENRSTASVAKVGDIQLRVVNADGSLYGNFVDSIREIQNSGSIAIGSQFRFSKGGEDISDLSLVWVSPAMEYVESEEEKSSSFDRDELYAVRFYQEEGEGPFYLSAPLAVVSAEENTKIDHFDAYLLKGTDGDQMKAVMQTTKYDISDPSLQEVVLLEGGGSVTLATPISAMKTATADFENSISVSDPIFDYYSVKHDSSLPVQITVTNTGKDKITAISVEMDGNEEKTTEFTDLSLMPNASMTLTLYQPMPAEDTPIENINYKVTATFGDSSTSSRSGTVEIQIPEAGISSVETTAEENGKRTIQLKMYNQSDVELAKMNGYKVKIGFYSDNTCNTELTGIQASGVSGNMDGNVLTISDAGILSLIDNDAFVGNFTYTLPESGFADGDITIYVRAWIEDADGNDVPYLFVKSSVALNLP